MNMMKKTISKEIASTGSEFLADTLLKLNNPKTSKGSKRVRGRRKKRMMAQQASQQAKAKEDLRKFLIFI